MYKSIEAMRHLSEASNKLANLIQENPSQKAYLFLCYFSDDKTMVRLFRVAPSTTSGDLILGDLTHADLSGRFLGLYYPDGGDLLHIGYLHREPDRPSKMFAALTYREDEMHKAVQHGMDFFDHGTLPIADNE